LLLDGRIVKPVAAASFGYRFRHPAIGPALTDLVG
jgi:NAD dependent epimerase/dehydratase family enzyme